MIQLCLDIEQSLIQELHLAFSLVIHMALKDINSIIFILILLLFLEMPYSMRFPYLSCSNQFLLETCLHESVPSSPFIFQRILTQIFQILCHQILNSIALFNDKPKTLQFLVIQKTLYLLNIIMQKLPLLIQNLQTLLLLQIHLSTLILP
jgi:hypothetical protein